METEEREPDIERTSGPRTRLAIVSALNPHAFARLWGMTLVERLLRQLSEIGVTHATVLCPTACAPASFLRSDFSQWTDIEVEAVEADADDDAALREALSGADGRVVVVDGHVVVDVRILDHLAAANGPRRFDVHGATLATVATLEIDDLKHQGLAAAPARVVTADGLDSYLEKTRKHVVPYVLPIESAEDLRAAERITFSAVYKGATDFITKFVFFHPARWIVRAVSPTRITPNQITIVSMVLSFGAIVPFFMGRYVEAVAMGFAMALLDTVDGKLARTTLRTSESGHLLDHISDTAYLLLWYIGLGWSLSGGRIFDFSGTAARMHAVLLVAFVADKILTGLFKRIYGSELHDFTQLDYTARIFIARRNPFLVGMVIALAAGRPMLGIQIIAGWYVATFAFHLFRFVYLPLQGEKHRSEAG